jgi:DNA-binding XRE family transcriptional regulator
MGFIYQIRNTLNGMCYIGKTERTIAQRFAGHVNDALSGSSRPICVAIREHGVEKFEVTEILPFENDQLNEAERAFIVLYGTLSPAGYNATPGGDGSRKRPASRPVLESLSARVLSLCEERGLSQRQLAIQAGLDPSYISRIIRGQTEPGLVTLAALAEVFGMTPSELLKGVTL